jgi:hypothetical protein
MNNLNDTFYSHSGQFGPVGIVMMIVLGSGVGAVVGAVYGALIYWIPFVYLNFLGTILVGFAAGGMVYLGAVVGKVRNPTLCAMAGITAGCVTLWGAWVGWIYVLSADGGTGLILLRPSHLWEAMVAIGQEGVWSIGRSSSEPVKGFMLYLVWIIEAGMIVVAAAITALALLSDKPFCERCSCWANNKTKLPKLRVPQGENAFEGLGLGDISSILALQRGSREGMHVQVELLGCRTCDQTYLASVSVVVKSTDKKGKSETNTTNLVRNLRLSAEDYQALREFKGVTPAPDPIVAAAE